MTFGEKLQELRKARGWSQEELAGQIHVSRQALSKWESGGAVPDTENIIALSRLFGVTTDYLLGREPAPDDPIEMLSRELNLNLYEKAIVTAYLAMDTKSRTDLVKMVQTVADAVQNGTESKYTYTIQVAARGDAAKSRQEQGEDVTVSTTLGAVEDQMEETAKAKEEASS